MITRAHVGVLRDEDGQWSVIFHVGDHVRFLGPRAARSMAERMRAFDGGVNDLTCDALERAAAHCERDGAGPA